MKYLGTACLLSLAVSALAGAAIERQLPISDPSFGPTAHGITTPKVVALGGGYLALWLEGGSVRGIRLRSDGWKVDQSSFVVADVSFGPMAAFAVSGSDGEAFVVAREMNRMISHLSRVRDDGSVELMSTALPSASISALVHCGSYELGLYDSDRAIHGIVIRDDDGAVVADVPLVTTETGQFTSFGVAATSTGFILGWIDSADRKVRVGAFPLSDLVAGRVVAIADTPVQPPGAAIDVQLAARDSSALVTWSEGVSGAEFELRERGLTAAAEPASAQIALGRFAIGSGFCVAANGDTYIAAVASTQRIDWIRFKAESGVIGLSSDSSGTIDGRIAIASGGTTALAVMQVRFFNEQVWAEAIDSSGFTVGGTIASVARTPQTPVALFPNGTGWLAMWLEAAPAPQVAAGRVDATGQPLDGPGVRLASSLQPQVGASAAWNGAAMLAVWLEPQSTTGKAAVQYAFIWVGENGFLTSSPARTAGLSDFNPTSYSDPINWDSDSTTCAWNGREWVIAWASDGMIVAARVSATGTLIDSVPTILTPRPLSPFTRNHNPRIAWNGLQYLVVWQKERFYCPFIGIPEPICTEVNDLAARRVSPALVPSSIVMAIAEAGDRAGATAQGHGVASGPGTWLIAWTGGDLSRAQSGYTGSFRISQSGALLDPVNGTPIPGGGFEQIVIPTSTGWLVIGFRGFMGLAANGFVVFPYRPVIAADGWIRAAAVNGASIVVAFTDSDERAYLAPVLARRRSVRP